MPNLRLAPDSNQNRQDFQLSHRRIGRSVGAVVTGVWPMAVYPMHRGWTPQDRIRCHFGTDSAGHHHRQLEWERRNVQGSQEDTDRANETSRRTRGCLGPAGLCQGASARVTNTKAQRWTRKRGWGHFLRSQPRGIDVITHPILQTWKLRLQEVSSMTDVRVTQQIHSRDRLTSMSALDLPPLVLSFLE